MKTNQTLTRSMGSFNVLQRTSDGFFNAKKFTDDFNAFFKCEAKYNEFFKEEADVLKLIDSDQVREYLPFVSFVHLASWLYPSLTPYALTLSSSDSISLALQKDFKAEDSRSFMETFYKLKSEAASVSDKNKADTKTYLIKDLSSEYIKIGKTKDVSARIKSLKVGNPDIELIMLIDGDVEKLLHEKYQNKRVSGEWFNLTTDDLIDINEFTNTNLKF